AAGGAGVGAAVLARLGGAQPGIAAGHLGRLTRMPDELPEHVAPMLATLGSLDDLGADSRWGFEMKWDGVRAIVQVERGRVRLWSRNDIDMSVSYPEFAALGKALPGRSAV